MFKIADHHIGPNYPTYIIAEISANHHQQFEESLKLLQVAKEIGADAVKLQTFTADTLTIKCDTPEFVIGNGTPWTGRLLHDLYDEAYMPWEWQPKLKEAANDLEIDLFSSPFDKTAVDFLERMDIPAYKVASFEIVDIPLIEYIASKGKPVIISTGMATLEEIKEAVRTATELGNDQLALLKCISAYPSSPEEMNLRSIPHLAELFGVPAGLSDHTLWITVPLAAVALGACIVEKHFTLSRTAPGPDSSFSLEPQEFREMVGSIRIAEKALGEARYGSNERENKNRIFRRSIFVVEDIKIGTTITEENVRSIRPGYGLHPRHLKEVLGRQAVQDIARGTPLNWDLIS